MYIHHILFIYSSTDEHLGCSIFGALWMKLHWTWKWDIFFSSHDSVFFRNILRSKIAGSSGSSNKFLMEWLGFSIKSDNWQRGILLYFLLFYLCGFYFCYLFALQKTSSTILSKSGVNSNIFWCQIIEEMSSSLQHWIWCWPWVLHTYPLLC